MQENKRLEADHQVEQLKLLIISSLENNEASRELWELSPLPRDPRLGFVLGTMAEIEVIYRSFEPEFKEKFKKGIVHVIAELVSDDKGQDILDDVIYLAGYTRAFEATPQLIDIVNGITTELDREESKRILRSSISTLGHFAINDDDEIKKDIVENLKKWFYDSNYERFAGMLMNGICECYPEDYYQYLPRFLDVANRHPDYFIVGSCIDELIRVVTPPKIQDQIDVLPQEVRKLVQERINLRS